MRSQRARRRLAWSPAWEGPVKKWAEKFIAKNRWRCDPITSAEDLLQDAYLTFRRVADKYPRVMNQNHFLVLFQRSMCNEMHDRARVIKRIRESYTLVSGDLEVICGDRISSETNEGYFRALIAEAPDELKSALAIFEQNPQVLREEVPTPHRENLNMRLRRVLGLDTGFDFVTALREILG